MDDDSDYTSGTPTNSSSTEGTPTTKSNIYVDIEDNDNVITMVDENNNSDNLDNEENDNRSINSYGNINEENEVLKVKKVKHYKLKKFKNHLDYCKTTRNVNLLKYHDLAFIINIIQISVIIVSTCITFFETIRQDININEDKQRVLSVVLSTYIALIVAISRFLKFDEKKEQFSKLIEKWNQTINKMRMMQYEVESLDSYHLNPSDMKRNIHKILNPQYREDISIVDNETDNLLNMKEKTHYKNLLMNMRLDDQILDRHDTLFYIYKRLENVVGFNFNIDKYRRNYLPCLSTGCYVSNYDAFFGDMENICKKCAEEPYTKKMSKKNNLYNKKSNDISSDDGFEYDNVDDCVKDAYCSRSKYHLV